MRTTDRHFLLPRFLSYLVIALLILFTTHSHAQIGDILRSGCIGPCRDAMCCGQPIILDPNGIGTDRHFDCGAFLGTAADTERETICFQLHAADALCDEIRPFCPPQADCECKKDAERQGGRGSKLFQLNFKGDEWCSEWKNDLEQAFAEVALRLRKVAQRLQVLTAKALALPEACAYRPELLRQLGEIDRIVRGVSSDVFTHHGDFKLQIRNLDDDVAAAVPAVLKKPLDRITFSNNRKNCYFSKDADGRARTLFHELSHHQGTRDKAETPNYNNAHYLAEAMFPFDDFKLPQLISEIIEQTGESGCPQELWPDNDPRIDLPY